MFMVDLTCGPAVPRIRLYALIGGTQGIPQVAIDSPDGSSRYGTICRDGFDRMAARVACSELGLAGGEVAPTSHFPDEYAGTQMVNSVSCTGRELFLANCTYSVWGRCPSMRAASIICTPARLNGLRLASSATPGTGHLEARVGRRWGSVCSSGFGEAASRHVDSCLLRKDTMLPLPVVWLQHRAVAVLLNGLTPTLLPRVLCRDCRSFGGLSPAGLQAGDANQLAAYTSLARGGDEFELQRR